MNRLVARAHGVRRGLGQLREARMPWLIAALVLAIQAGVEAGGGYLRHPEWFEWFGLSRAGVLRGWLWQPLSYALLHGSWAHAILNVVCLLLLGTRVEHVLGSRRLVRAMVASILGGAAGHLLLAVEKDLTLVGISGAAYGLLLLVTTLSPDSKMWPLMVSGRWLGVGLLVTTGLLALMDPALGVPGLADLGRWMSAQGMEAGWKFSHGCHFGGGLAGWLYGRWLLRPRVTLAKLRRERERREKALSTKSKIPNGE
ncbi:rhomboid family intramembrane serine protease [Luteolibacter sp. LG18]|uniref:rhomboid family intramembrane serine protease n=1 Tax=Luteolibacter sp. LG18 TaxID=2819286 RepID=UPI002B2F242E|nr:hypothetical protein llg_25540 [Luteolibacter sp. LG18]